jgi:CRP/FNR family transcriptional regulator, cyclic AMP receptor protein
LRIKEGPVYIVKTLNAKAFPKQSTWHLDFPLLADVANSSALAILARAKISKSSAGSEVIGQLSSAHELHFLLVGECRSVFYSQNGIEVGFRRINAGSYFGELGVLTDRPRVSAVVADSDVLTARMTKADFMNLLRLEPHIAVQISINLASHVQALTSRIIEFNTLNVRQRIWIELARMAQHATHTAGLTPEVAMPTHEEIASNVGVNREAVTRELRAMKVAGLINYDRRFLKFYKLSVLQSEAQKADLIDFAELSS